MLQLGISRICCLESSGIPVVPKIIHLFLIPNCAIWILTKRSLKSVSFCVSAGYYSGYKKNHEMSIALGAITYPCLCWWNPCLHRLNHRKFYLLFVGQTGVNLYLPNNFNGENVWTYANAAQDWSPCSEKPETSFWGCFGGLIPNFVGKISSTDTSSRLRCCPKRPLNRKSPKCQVARRWFARWFKACFPKGKFTMWLGNRKGESVCVLKVSFLANPSFCGYHVDDNHFFRGWIPMITCSATCEIQIDTVHWRPTKSCWCLEIHNMDVCNTWWQNNKSLCWHMFTCGISNFQTNQLLLVVLTYIPIGLCLVPTNNWLYREAISDHCWLYPPYTHCEDQISPFHTTQLVECYPRRLGLREHFFRKPQSISWEIP